MMTKLKVLHSALIALIPAFCAAGRRLVLPSNVRTGGVDVSTQDIAIDANGNGVAVRVENGHVMMGSSPKGGDLSFPIASLLVQVRNLLRFPWMIVRM